MRKTAPIQQVNQAPEPDKYETHAALAAEKLDLKDLDLNERAFLGTCQDIYRNSRGTATPFENFITTVIRWATWGNPPTPENLIEEIKTETQEDFEMTLHSVKRFMQNYPDVISELKFPPAPLDRPAAPETVQPAPKSPAKASRARKTRTKHAHAKAAA